MAYYKNKGEILERIIVDEARGELLSGEFQEELQTLHAGGKGISLRFELMPEDILYRLCKQKGIEFEDFSHLFKWFARENQIYVISQQFDADVELLRGMSHDKIIEAFKNPSENFRCLPYEFSGKEIYFLSYFEQAKPRLYYGKAINRKIAQKGMGFDEENCRFNPLCGVAMYKTDHQY